MKKRHLYRRVLLLGQKVTFVSYYIIFVFISKYISFNFILFFINIDTLDEVLEQNKKKRPKYPKTKHQTNPKKKNRKHHPILKKKNQKRYLYFSYLIVYKL